MCFRMGGDEFAAISDSQDEKGLLACLEDAKANLSYLADAMGLEAPTLCVGFSSVQTDGAKTYEDPLKYADKHLYQEKGTR
ncbi:diguanylate cyclase domain-containing protein [Tractidigestivibacter scatoligenes]|nr:diguanylate cyclase [Tractidigestivibacter scatoligenes]